MSNAKPPRLKSTGSTPDAGCYIRQLPSDLQVQAAVFARSVNPVNAPAAQTVEPPNRLAVLTARYWGAGGVRLTVSFMDRPSAALRAKILAHMNAWSEFCNVEFVETAGQGQVRIARGRGGYWSYLGTDILHVPANQQTMNLEGFTERTPESEFVRVVRHETGHTLGLPHEHLRRDLVERLDPQKVYRWFRQNQGWDDQTIRSNVLTPLDERSIISTPNADQDSIMAYFLPGEITRDGKPIRGGNDFSADDRSFAGRIYPKASTPGPNPPAVDVVTLVGLDVTGKEVKRFKAA